MARVTSPTVTLPPPVFLTRSPLTERVTFRLVPRLAHLRGPLPLARTLRYPLTPLVMVGLVRPLASPPLLPASRRRSHRMARATRLGLVPLRVFRPRLLVVLLALLRRALSEVSFHYTIVTLVS